MRGNAALQARYPLARTDIPPGEAALVERWDQRGLSFLATRQACPRFGFTGLLQPGTECVLGDRPWQVHAAPGHDPHSVILFDAESRTLISADALWENGFGVRFELAGEPSFADVGATLDPIGELAPKQVIPGRGAVFDDVDKALSVARRRLDGLRRDPVKQAATHAIKVLMKFKLLEVQSISVADWNAWCGVPLTLEAIRSRFFGAVDLDQLK